MDSDVIALINSGATTILGLMLTDTWDQAKVAAAKLFSRREKGSQSQIEADLEDTRRRLMSMPESSVSESSYADIAAEWRERLRREIEEDTGSAALLREFVDQYSEGANDKYGATDRITMNAIANGSSRIYQQARGTQNIY